MSTGIDLYSFIHFDRGSRVRWLANELGLTINEHRLDARAGEHKGAAYRAVNPTGLVPAIVQNGVTQFDSAAICLSLAEAHREAKLAIFEGESGRGEFLSWYFFAASTLDAATYPLMVYKMFQPDPAMLEASTQRLMTHLAALDRRMLDRDWVCGRFTIADILLGHGLELQRRCDVNFAEFPALAAYHARLKSRPAGVGLFAN
ncbi:MAG: glutathione S-transferase family protein [Rhodanobacteraceae bacterium]|nr:glutathione S-transferase family protein [Rhodanobacteraceae bacterium]MBK7043616.1 glutathione S-transferase family protein [Rhodanobacteraceae bacterium]MBP9154603.1 glutathione S-transferase family protein [Xanthomonadales bacterium]HQW80870.1 glutathione S-transferase family protein [Pseudomonadota bacterium]